VVLGAFLFLNERSGARVIAGLLFCHAGGGALIGQSYRVDPARLTGDFYGIITAFFFGAYVLAVRHARAHHGAARLVFLSTAVSAFFLLGAAIAIPQQILPQTAASISALLALALVSQAGGQGLLTIALGTLPATFSSLVIFLEGVAAAAFGWLVLGEKLTFVQALGGLLILFGIFIARPRTSPPPGAVP
jgi:drug/metabolite transporter (DMT)-like permease